MMSSCVALCGEVHLGILYRVFAHTKKYHNTELVLIHQIQLSIAMVLKEKIGAAQILAVKSRWNEDYAQELLNLEAWCLQ